MLQHSEYLKNMCYNMANTWKHVQQHGELFLKFKNTCCNRVKTFVFWIPFKGKKGTTNSVTKRLHYLFNIWPFSTAKNYPIALKIAKSFKKISNAKWIVTKMANDFKGQIWSHWIQFMYLHEHNRVKWRFIVRLVVFSSQKSH